MPRSDKTARRMLTTEEAAAYLGTTARHVRRLVSDHELSQYKVGGRNRFADVELDEWLATRRVDARRPRVVTSSSYDGGRAAGASPLARP